MDHSLAFCVICPVYSGRRWPKLPRLAAGIAEFGTLVADYEVAVERIPVDSPAVALRALSNRAKRSTHLIVYVGGHGLVENGEHLTALEESGEHPDTLDSIWMRQLADVLSRSAADVVLFVDTCFSGQAAVNLDQALKVLAASPTRTGFGLIAACRAFETTDDGRFVDALLALVSDGPRSDPSAWGPHDEAIRLGALIAELTVPGVHVKEVFTGGASELRLIPNPGHDPKERPGRVHIKRRLRRLSGGAEDHLLDKSEGFVGRSQLRRRIAEWLQTSTGGMFVVTGGPGTGKSALIGLLARQSVGDPVACAADGPCLPERSFDVIVHAHQKTAADVQANLAGIGAPATILVDAVDEAVAGEAVGIASYLRSLSRRPGVRLVVGSRPSPVVASRLARVDLLLAELGPSETANLGEDPATAADMVALITALLGVPGSPYQGSDIADLAAEVAQRTAPSFLFAHTAARWLNGRPPITGYPDWRRRLAGFGTDTVLGSLIDEDLAARFSGAELQRARDLLRALAWTEGLGLPRYTIWPEFANALSPTLTTYGDPDVTWVLEEAGWYITEAGEDGQTVYRLFHQALVDWFREETRLG